MRTFDKERDKEPVKRVRKAINRVRAAGVTCDESMIRTWIRAVGASTILSASLAEIRFTSNFISLLP